MWPDTFVLASIRLGKGAGARDKQPASAGGCCESDILSVGARRMQTNIDELGKGVRTHDKRHARTHLHPRHRKQHLAPVDQPRRWVTRPALTAFSQLPPPPTVEAPTPVLGSGVGGMLPARTSVNVDEHHSACTEKVDPLPNSVTRAWIRRHASSTDVSQS